MHIPEHSQLQVSQLVHDLNTKGFGCIANYIQQEDLYRMRRFVNEAVAGANHEYVHFNGPEAVCGSGLEELANSPIFRKLLYELYRRATGKEPMKQSFYQVLRCLAGKTGQKNSLLFHYDSYIVTALIPIMLPEAGMSGDLLIYPNTRKIRRAYLRNAVDKILLDNPLTQRVLRACVKSKKLGPIRVKMTPGNIYFLWGYRSIHTNEPCNPDQVRATALFHYANPHGQTSL